MRINTEMKKILFIAYLGFILFSTQYTFAEDVQPENSSFDIHYGLETRVGETFSTHHNQLQDGEFNNSKLRISSEWTTPSGIILKEDIHAASLSGFDRNSYDEIFVDELHATYNTANNCSFRLGFQKVIWGQADRLRVVNVINPLDLRESYYNEWDKKYLSLGMLNSECSFADQSIQILAIPQTRFYKLPINTQLLQAVNTNKESTNDWNFGIKWSKKFERVDLGLYGYHGYEQYRHPVVLGFNNVNLEANKYSMLGADFNSTIGPFTLRGEFAEKTGVSPYPLNNLPSTISIFNESIDHKINQESYLLGVDYPGATWNISTQYLNVVNHGVLNQLKNQQILTLAGQKYFLNNRVLLEAYSAIDLKKFGNNYLSLEGSYEINNHWRLKASTEFFQQNEQNFLDAIKYQNRIFFSVMLNI